MAGDPSKKDGSPKNSPFAGCSIIIVAVVMMTFLIGFTLWSLFKVNSEISKFTQADPIPAPLLDPGQFETEFTDLSRRLDGFESKVSLDEKAEIALSATDLNLSIAAHELFKDLQGTLSVKEITEQELAVQISYKLNGQPFGDGSPRYLNGILFGTPRLDGGQLLLNATRIESSMGAPVPEEFVAHLTDHQITAPYTEDQTLGPIMKKLTSVSLADGKLVFVADPGEDPPIRVVTKEEADSALKKGIFIFFGVLVVFILFLVVFLRGNKGARVAS